MELTRVYVETREHCNEYSFVDLLILCTHM